MNYTYLLECSDHSFYCGWTNDLDKRVMAHNSGNGAKYTKSRRPVALVYYETYETKEAAMKREAAIKRMSRREKERLSWGAFCRKLIGFAGSLNDSSGRNRA